MMLLHLRKFTYFVLKSRNSSHKSQTYQSSSNFIDDATLFSLTKRYFTLVLISINMVLTHRGIAAP